jgi:hypothetical protein
MNRPLKTVPNADEQICLARDLREGDLVDLESCPYCHDEPNAEYEYAEVCEIERESPDCIAVGYAWTGAGYDPMTPLIIKRRELLSS